METFHVKWRRSLQASIQQQPRAFYKLSVSLRAKWEITLRWNDIIYYVVFKAEHKKNIKRWNDFSHEKLDDFPFDGREWKNISSLQYIFLFGYRNILFFCYEIHLIAKISFWCYFLAKLCCWHLAKSREVKFYLREVKLTINASSCDKSSRINIGNLLFSEKKSLNGFILFEKLSSI